MLSTRYKHNTNQHSNFHPYQSFDPNTYVNKSQHGSNAKLKSFNSYNRNEHSNGNNDQFCNNNDNHNSNNYNNNNVNVNCPRNFRESTSYNTSYTNFNYNHLKFPNNTNNNNFNSPKTNRNNNNNNNNNKITQGRQYMKTCIISNASSDTFTAESANRKRENPFTKRSANFSQNDAKKRYVQQGPPLNDEEYKIKSKTNTKANRKNQNGRDKARNTRKTFNRSRGKGLPKKSYKNNVENFTGQKFNPNEDVEQGEEQKGEEKDNCEKENLEEEEADNCKENKKEEVNKEIRTDNTNAIKNVALKVEVTDKTLYNIEAKEFIQENNSNQLNLSVNEQIYSSNECSSVANVGENLEKSKKKRRSKTVSCDPSTENTVKEVEEISSETTKKDKKAKKPKEKKQKKLKESELDQELIADVAVEQENISVINSKRSALESINRSDTCSPKISLIPLTRLLAEEYLKLEDPPTNTDSNSRPISKHLGPTSNNPPPLKLKLLDQRNRSTCTEALSTTDACDAIMAKLTSMDKSSIKNIINTTDTKYDSALTSLARKRLREELRRQLKAINFDNSEQILNNDIVPDEICDSIHIPDRVLDEIRQVLGMDVYNNIPSNDVELSVNVLQKDEDKNNEMKKNIEHIEHFSLMPEEFSSGPSSALTESAQHNNHNNSLTDGNNLPTSTTQCNFGENLDEKNVTTGTVTKSLELCLKISPKRYRRNSSSSLMQHSAERDRTPVHPEQQNEQAIKLEKPAQYKNIKKKLMKKMKKMKKVRETKELLKKEAKKYMPEVIVIDSSTSSSSESSSSNSSASSSSSSSTTSSSTSDTDSDSTTYSSKSSASLKRKRLKLKFDAQNVIDSFDKLIVPSLSETLTDRYRMKYSTSVNTKLHFISCICTSEYNSEKFSKAEIEKIQKSLKSPDYSMALDFLMKQIVNVFNKQRKIAKSGEIKKLDNKKSDNSPLGKKSSLVINNKLKEQSPDVNNQISSTIETMPPDDDIRIKQCVSKMLSLYKEEMRAALESVKEKTITSKITDEYSKSLTEAIVEKQLPAAPDLSISEIVKGSKSKKDPKSKGDSNVLINNSQKRDNEVNINSQHNESEKHSSIITPQREQPKKQQMHQEKISVAKNGTAVCNENIRAIENMSNITSIDYNSFGYSDINSSTVALVQHSALASVDLDSFKQKHPIGEVVVNNLREIDLKLMELHKRKMFIEEMILKLQKEKMEADLLTIKLQNEKFILLNTAMTANATNNERQPTSNSPSTKSANYMTNIKVEKMEDVLSENSINQISEVNTTTDASNPKSNTNSNANAKLHSNLITGQKVLEVTSKNKGKVTTTLSSSTTTLPTSTTPSPSTRTTTTKRKNNGLVTTDQKTKRANNRKEGSTRSKDHSIKSNKIQGTSMENSSQKTTEINKTLLSPTSMPLAVTQSRNIDGIKSVINEIKVYEKNIVAGSEDGTLYMFDATTLKLITQFAKHTEAITQMYLCLEKRVIYTTSLDGYFKKTALENFELDVLSLYLQEPLQSLEVQWGIAYLGSRWGNIYTYNISENRVSENLLCTSTSSIIAIKATGNGTQKILIVSSKGNLVQLRDAITGLLLRTLDIPDTFNIYSILLDDNVIYCGTQKKEIYKYDLLSGSYLGSLSCGNGAVSMQIYNRYIFVGCYDGFIYILDKLTSILKDRLPGSGKMVLALEIYNNKIITSAKDRTMKIIDIPDYCLLHN